MDLSVNDAVKDFLRKRFQIWYSQEVERLYRATVPGNFTPVDLRMSILTPLGAEWLFNAYQNLLSNTCSSLAKNGFWAAGITSVLNCNCL